MEVRAKSQFCNVSGLTMFYLFILFFYSSISLSSVMRMLASSKLPSKIARNKLERMMLPKIISVIKKKQDYQPAALMQEYITLFQSSPKRT